MYSQSEVKTTLVNLGYTVSQVGLILIVKNASKNVTTLEMMAATPVMKTNIKIVGTSALLFF